MFIEQAVAKLLSRGKRTVREVALELNVSYYTAKNWMERKSPSKAGTSPGKDKRPQDWNAQEQLLALQETHALSGEALQAWCREKGLFARPRQQRNKPRALCATAPNELFSWDITYLPTLVIGAYFYLYLFMDIFSRKIVGWQIYETESSALASEVMRDICERENIAPHQVVLHSDNGSPMRGATMLATLQSLGVMSSFSRPAVSNDNPYSESLFKTLKYRPNYPARAFENLFAARQWVGTFVHWYNHEHRHSAVRFVTPDERHAGQDTALLGSQSHQVYAAAKAKHPQRWSGSTRNWEPLRVVHLNPEQQTNLKKTENQILKKIA